MMGIVSIVAEGILVLGGIAALIAFVVALTNLIVDTFKK